jgi:predicted GIY-YIG superfamily endonuclease
MKGVYLLHIEPGYGHARHYLGYSADIESRISAHMLGEGSPLIKAAVRWGRRIYWTRVWEDTGRTWERYLKRRHNAPALCPVCSVGKFELAREKGPGVLGSKLAMRRAARRLDNELVACPF